MSTPRRRVHDGARQIVSQAKATLDRALVSRTFIRLATGGEVGLKVGFAEVEEAVVRTDSSARLVADHDNATVHPREAAA